MSVVARIRAAVWVLRGRALVYNVTVYGDAIEPKDPLAPLMISSCHLISQQR